MCSNQNEFYIEHRSSNRNIPKAKTMTIKLLTLEKKKTWWMTINNELYLDQKNQFQFLRDNNIYKDNDGRNEIDEECQNRNV